jgi:hypothetical protein
MRATGWLGVFLLAVACEHVAPVAIGPPVEEPLPPDYWDPGRKPIGCGYGSGGYGNTCPDPIVDCRHVPCAYGHCVEAEEGDQDTCVCDTGYTGVFCDECAAGYVPDGLQCALFVPCQEDPCVYGTCRANNGAWYCDCFTGYAGTLCDGCAVGYHLDELACVADGG